MPTVPKALKNIPVGEVRFRPGHTDGGLVRITGSGSSPHYVRYDYHDGRPGGEIRRDHWVTLKSEPTKQNIIDMLDQAIFLVTAAAAHLKNQFNLPDDAKSVKGCRSTLLLTKLSLKQDKR